MKIRGKLTLSFSVLSIIILSVLGLIIYKTFGDSITRLEDQIYSKKISGIYMKLDAAIDGCMSDIKLAAVELVAEEAVQDSGEVRQPIAQNILRRHSKVNELVSSVYLMSPDGRQIARGSDAAGLSSKELKKLLSKTDESPFRDPFVLKGVDRLLMVKPIIRTGFSKHPYLVIYEIKIRELGKLILPDMDGEAALCVISKNGVPVIEISSKKGPFTGLSVKNLLSGINRTGGPEPVVSKLDDFYAFSSSLESTGYHLTYIVPSSTYFRDLITLKNRIIVAIVAIFWVSIWVVLIIAFGISKHLELLSKAAKDMMALNYETPIKVIQTNDEIQDLANSFELMRLRIKDLVLKDHLTDIYNRRYLVQFLESEMAKTARSGNGLSVAMIDIDHFKNINDTYGHDCGDKVLVAVGQSLKQMIRDYEIVARYGGEEFVVVFPNIDRKQAFIAAERLRTGIESAELLDTADIRLTVSIGVSSYRKGALDSPDALINAADIALYQAKEAGRNKTVAYTAQRFKLAR